MAPCIIYNPRLPGFWQSIEKNNRAAERFIGKLKIIVNALIRDKRSNLVPTDLRILAALHNIV